mgnify:FL=1
MYSKDLERLLQKLNVSLGDRIHVKNSDFDIEGLLMPRAKESEILVIKMDTGYNVGINSKHAEIKLIKKQGLANKQPEKDIHRGDVALLSCGGTIASKIDYKTGAVFPAISPSEFRASFPQINEIATIHTKNLF